MCYRHAAHRGWAQHSHGWKSRGRRGRGFGPFSAFAFQAPVNVKEWDDRYELYVYAPGLTKGDFKISLTDRLLSIRVENQESDESTDSSFWRRREFRTEGFTRRFELNEKVDQDAIKADYDSGVLTVTLPKLDDFHTSRQDIEVV